MGLLWVVNFLKNEERFSSADGNIRVINSGGVGGHECSLHQ